jgi:hypothetical protein
MHHMLTDPKQRHGEDPLRAIDLMLPEDIVRRHNAETTVTVVAFRTAALMIVLALVAVMLVQTSLYRDRLQTAAKIHQGMDYTTPFDGRGLW